MGTLVERLRAFPDNVLEGAPLCEEAADLITAQQRTIELQGNEVRSLEDEIARLKRRYEPQLPDAAVNQSETYMAYRDKVKAIKAYRARVGCSLREAAYAIDAALSAQRGGE